MMEIESMILYEINDIVNENHIKYYDELYAVMKQVYDF